MKIVEAYILLALAMAGCSTTRLPANTTERLLRETIIPRLDWAEAPAHEIVVFLGSAYDEYRGSDQPDIVFIPERSLKTIHVRQDPHWNHELLDQHMSEEATVWDEIERLCQLANLSFRIETNKIIFEDRMSNNAIEHTEVPRHDGCGMK